jgi:hypothetical protein
MLLGLAAFVGCDAAAPGPGPGAPEMDDLEPGTQSSVEVAVADLAERLQIDPEQVTLRSLDPVVWPDAGLGCPQPEVQYAQVPVEGARIRLEVDGVTYDYHAGGGRPEPFLCDRARAREPEGGIDPDRSDLEQNG